MLNKRDFKEESPGTDSSDSRSHSPKTEATIRERMASVNLYNRALNELNMEDDDMNSGKIFDINKKIISTKTF